MTSVEVVLLFRSFFRVEEGFGEWVVFDLQGCDLEGRRLYGYGYGRVGKIFSKFILEYIEVSRRFPDGFPSKIFPTVQSKSNKRISICILYNEGEEGILLSKF